MRHKAAPGSGAASDRRSGGELGAKWEPNGSGHLRTGPAAHLVFPGAEAFACGRV
jgi:hypothetical protein